MRGAYRRPISRPMRALGTGGLGVLLVVVLLLPGVNPPGLSARVPSAAVPFETGGPRTTSSLQGTWTNLSSTVRNAPPRQCCGAMAYDAAAGYILYFGGGGLCGPCNYTWAYAEGSWRNLTSSLPVSPASREWASLAYDPALGGAVLFGGIRSGPGSGGSQTALQDTWEFVNGRWSELSPMQSPNARWSAGMSWDGSANDLVLFGGFSSAAGYLSDTWTFSGGSWAPVHTPVHPPARWAPSMTYDAADHEVLLFGGYNGTAGFFGDTWAWTGVAWLPVAGGPSPPIREKGVMDFDPATGSVVLFGGDYCPTGCIGGTGLVFRGDTWQFRGGQWQNVSVAAGAAAPPPRCCAVSAYDGADGVWVTTMGGGPLGLVETGLYSFAPTTLGGLTVGGLFVSPAAPIAGAGLTIDVGAAGNRGYLTYAYQGLPPGCASENSSVLYCVTQRTGPYVVDLLLEDAGGSTTNSTVSFEVYPAPPPTAPPPPPPLVPLWAVELGVGLAALLLVLAFTVGRQRLRPRKGPRPEKPAMTSPTGDPAPPDRTTTEDRRDEERATSP